jgi:transposase-like protein
VIATRNSWSDLALPCRSLSGFNALPIMQVNETIQCPFCGQSSELGIDTSVASQRFTTDCEVCCRPFEVTVECEPGEILSIDVQGG